MPAALTLGIFGDPVAHSRSPDMHAAAFGTLGLPHRYLPFRVADADLPEALAGARAMGFRGLNLTVPHKRAGARWVDSLEGPAARIEAINTVVFEPDGVSRGHNTDGAGFARALADLPGATIERAVVLGAGGASLAIVDALLADADARSRAFELRWVSRDPASPSQRAPRLAADPRVRACSYEDWAAAPASTQLWVNTTTVGMHGGPASFPVALPLAQLDEDARVVDIVYPRPAGGLLDVAQARGARVLDGRAMLLWQGVRALELWLARELEPQAVTAMAAVLGLKA